MEHLIKAAVDVMGAHTKDAHDLMPGKHEWVYYDDTFDIILTVDISQGRELRVLWDVTGYLPKPQRAKPIFSIGNHVSGKTMPPTVHYFDERYILLQRIAVIEMGQCRPVGVR